MADHIPQVPFSPSPVPPARPEPTEARGCTHHLNGKDTGEGSGEGAPRTRSAARPRPCSALAESQKPPRDAHALQRREGGCWEDWDAPRGATPWGQGRGAQVGGVRPGRALPSDLRSALGHGTGFAATTATTLSGTHTVAPIGGDTHKVAPPEVAPSPPRRCRGRGWCWGGSRAHPARPPSPAMPGSHGEAASPPSCPPSVTSSGAGERGNFPSALSTVF